MNQIQLFKIFILYIFLSVALSLDLKPDNNKNLVKINIDGKNRTYYHLKKNDEIIYTLSENGIENFSEKYSLKLITRTLIASNSNSNKIFGVELNIYEFDEVLEEDVLVISRNLKYNKVSSEAVSDSKPGWNYTKAGFWFEEIDNLKNKVIKIKLLDGSPETEVKLILKEINYRSSESELVPITMKDEYVIQYKDHSNDDYISSDNWYLLEEDNPLQYKISGPKIIRFISRISGDDLTSSNNYSFSLREDGKFVSNYIYEANLSANDAFVENENNLLSGYNSSFYNIPKGIHYYSFFFDYANSNGIYLKLEEYENK